MAVEETPEDKECEREVITLMRENRVFTLIVNERIFGGVCGKWHLQCFPKSTHLFMDIVYIRNNEVPGLFNMVAPCEELRCYVPVFRIFVNKQDAIAEVIYCVFAWVDKKDSEFNMGEKIEQIMVDFSDAEENGLKDALGSNFVKKVLRGCEFHYMKSVVKVAKLQAKN